MIPRDTTPDAAAMQASLYRRMSGARRCEVAASLAITARALTLAGIRRRHPEYDERQARFALLRVLVGDELFRRAWPTAPIVAP